jgi:hypothetical protein
LPPSFLCFAFVFLCQFTHWEMKESFMKLFARLIILISCVTLSMASFAQSPMLLRTFTPPMGGGGYFGGGMAAMGSDRVLIGAPNGGFGHLFHTNGTLLQTFTNPEPSGTLFGSAITSLGNERVVIGSTLGYSVYLFTTNGALVKTITDQIWQMGTAVSAFGNDKLLIGAFYANEDFERYVTYGAAYLYSTNGTRLMTFTNPTPETVNGLGYSVATFSNDRVLIAASTEWVGSGAAYLFHTNGTRLMTFTNPAPSGYSYFGRSIAAVGMDRVLVGSPAEGAHTEAVYLFNTNGTHLLTITNPTPAADDWFGNSFAIVGNDRVVVGAPFDDTTGLNSGCAYVFSLNNGALLATINHPALGVGDRFGWRVAAFGNDGVIISAPHYSGVGSAYLFSIPSAPGAPSLSIRRAITNTVSVSWPSTATGFTLQQITNLTGANWTFPLETVTDNGTNKSIIISNSTNHRYFRLFKP